MKKLFLFLTFSLLGGIIGIAAGNAVVPRIYGIRVMSGTEDSKQALVSFPADAPSSLTEETDLSRYLILAAACDDGVYHIITTDDGIVPARYLHLDLASKKITEVASYDWKIDLAGSLLVQDMTYDPADDTLYTIAFDLSKAEMIEGEIEAPFGTYSINPATGEAKEIGMQEITPLLTIAANKDHEWYSIDNEGNLWFLRSSDGAPDVHLLHTGIMPDAQQSMSFDMESGVCYWVSSSASEGGSKSRLHTLSMDEDREWSMTTIGEIADNSRLIGLYVESNPVENAAPASIESLTVTPAPLGAPEASLSWKNPSLTIGGETLGELGADIYRDGTMIQTLSDCIPGEESVWTDTDVPSGLHTYFVMPVSAGKEGKPTYADEIFVGTDTPGAPKDVTATKAADSYTVTIAWDAPTSGQHGGWFDASQPTYSILRNPGNERLAEGLTETTYTDASVTAQHGYIYSVIATTSAGQGPAGISNTVISGPALDIPYTMDLNDPDQVNLWTAVNTDGDEYTWYAYDQGWGGTFDTFFRYYPENILDPTLETDDWLISPAMRLEAGKMYLAKYDIRLLGDLFPANTTLALGTAPDAGHMMMTLERSDNEINDIAWTTHSIPFTVDETGEYHFGFQTRNAVPVQWFRFRVAETSAIDLAVSSPTGSTLANAGVESDYVVTVTNVGFDEVDEYTVTLTDEDGKTLTSKEVKEALASQASAAISLTWTPTAAGSVSLYAGVKTAGDNNAVNDTAGPLQVDVMGGGFAVDVTDGTSGSGYTPFYLSYANSAVQTIYTAKELGDIEKGNISSITYYVYNISASNGLSFDAEVALANVEDSQFSGSGTAMIPEERFTTVFSGELTMENGQATLPVMFDRTFEYTGGNLCVFTRHHKTSGDFASVIFKARYGGGDPLCSCLYRSDEAAFDYTQDVNAYRDRPNASFFFAYEATDGIETSSGDTTDGIRYSRASRTLSIDGDYVRCRIHSVYGTLLGEYRDASEIRLDRLPSGMAIVEVITEKGKTTAKITL